MCHVQQTLKSPFDMNATEEEVNPYELLNIKLDSTEKEIKTAYRQKSLKVHPDRVCLALQLDTPQSKVLV